MAKDGPDAVKKLIKEQAYPVLNAEFTSLQSAINSWADKNSVGARNARNALLKKQTKVQNKIKELNKW